MDLFYPSESNQPIPILLDIPPHYTGALHLLPRPRIENLGVPSLLPVPEHLIAPPDRVVCHSRPGDQALDLRVFGSSSHSRMPTPCMADNTDSIRVQANSRRCDLS